MKIKVLVILMFILTSLLCDCSNMVNGKDIADKQIPGFHQLFNERRFQDIVTSSDPDMIKASPEATIIELFEAIHRKLGTVTESTNMSWNVNTFNLETRVVLVQNTSFERGSGTETFTYRITDGKARLLGYFINSNDLIIQ